IHSSLDPRGLPLRRTRGGTGFSDQGLPVRSPSGLKRIMMAAYQKDDARKQAFQTWAHEWHRGQQDRSSGTKPRSFAYTHTLTKPPDGGSHPLWQAATAKEKNTQGKNTKKPLFTQRTTSTAIQVAVDHAFTGTYVTRFHPTDPPEACACPCGYYIRSSTHIIHACHRYATERCRAHVLFVLNNPTSFHEVLKTKKQALRLLTFLQESRALSRPESSPRAYEPPKPD